MAELKEIITDLSKLQERCDEIDTVKEMKEAREIIAELKKVIRKKELASLAAPALGYNKRIFCINFSDNEVKTFINPVIMNAEGLALSDERPAILEGRRFLVPRNTKINLYYTTPLGKVENREITGVASSVVQQEIHMLDGIQVCDIGLEIDDRFDEATEEEREELINAYLDSLDLKAKEIDEEIQQDSDLKQISDAIDFMTKKGKGEIETVAEEVPKEFIEEKLKDVQRDNDITSENK